jgi:hypothetical protein
LARRRCRPIATRWSPDAAFAPDAARESRSLFPARWRLREPQRIAAAGHAQHGDTAEETRELAAAAKIVAKKIMALARGT